VDGTVGRDDFDIDGDGLGDVDGVGFVAEIDDDFIDLGAELCFSGAVGEAEDALVGGGAHIEVVVRVGVALEGQDAVGKRHG
jgi:hypothetical protein